MAIGLSVFAHGVCPETGMPSHFEKEVADLVRAQATDL